MTIDEVIAHLTQAAAELKDGMASEMLIEIGDFEHDIQMIVTQDDDLLIVCEACVNTVEEAAESLHTAADTLDSATDVLEGEVIDLDD